MIYLLLFWILAIALTLLYVIGKVTKSAKVRDAFEKYSGGLIFVISIPLLIMALITKDPATILGITITPEIQWLASILFAGFGLWKVYLDPMKKEIGKLNREMGEVKAKLTSTDHTISTLEKDIHLIKSILFKMNLKKADRRPLS